MFTEKATTIVLIIIFVLMIGIAGKCDADNERDIEKEKIELQEYLGEDYEIN